MNPYERLALQAELLNCEYRIEQIQTRLAMINPDDGVNLIPAEDRPRAEARLAAIETRAQEILQILWPVDARFL